MNKLKRLWDASPQRKLIFIRVCLYLPFAHFCVKLFPLKRLIRIFKLRDTYREQHHSRRHHNDELYIRDVAWGISAALLHLPLMDHTKCLAQALTARHLLSKKDICAKLTIGANKEDTTIAAHAWIVVRDQILNFGSDPNDFKVITSFY